MQITKDQFEAHFKGITSKFFQDLADSQSLPGMDSDFLQSSKAMLMAIRPVLRLAIKTGYVEAIQFITRPPEPPKEAA